MLGASSDSILASLNGPQREAVTHGDGPLLIFAGAGSGKTRVLTNRIAYLLETHGVAADQILAVTFTNKAAKEMRERIERLVGGRARAMWVGTFHALCARFLRMSGEAIGVPQNFVILDPDDQGTVMTDCYAEFNVDATRLKPNSVLNRISSAKNELKTPADLAATAQLPDDRMVAKLYARYQEKLESNCALDFDDLIMQTAHLFQTHPEVLQEYQERFRYVFVDEYQDINRAQYEFIAHLSRRYRNICVVGDDDQSIYTWRGANAKLLLKFERDYPEARVIKLEQNYRSPQTILDAAYAVICQNATRKEKRLWTERSGGERLKCYRAQDEHGEAAFVARQIRDLVGHGGRRYRDCAILYRINAMSRVLEQLMISQGIPYRIIGGLKFFSRKEIKDILAYLRVLYNPDDGLALKRIINVPTRGIGATTIAKLEELAATRRMSLFQVVLAADYADLAPRAQSAVREFATMMTRLMTLSTERTITEMTDAVIDESGYAQMLRADNSVQARTRLENIRELLSATQEFESEAADESGKTLQAFLEQVALMTELEEKAEDADSVTLMTLHAAKGLEFPVVFLTGMEEGVFPMARTALSGKPDDLEEERRLCYVGITRAEQLLYFTLAGSRQLFGQTSYNRESRFLRDIPGHLIESVDGTFTAAGVKKPTWKEAASAAPEVEAILTAARPAGFRTGDRVRHQAFGEGIVLATIGSGEQMKVTVNFPRVGTKTLVLAYAPLERLSK
jgi:DNA helicase-2/ATP-dependent DNA helicase PcrA